jgi:hypothetical protein
MLANFNMAAMMTAAAVHHPRVNKIGTWAR